MQNKFRKNKYDLGELEKEAAVCQDFAVFCGYIVENKVKTSKKPEISVRRIALR